VLRTLARTGPTTRPQLSTILSFSKPTMSVAVAELIGQGLVSPFGSTQGSTGRRATIYGLGAGAGHVIGIDAGSTQVRALAQTLDGRRLAEVEERLAKGQRHVSAETSTAVRAAADSVAAAVGRSFGPLRAIAVALPAIVSANRPEIAHKGDIETLLGAFGPAVAVPLILENNVNCAALAEMHHGAARERSSFAYLQVGVKIGLGIVHEGRLFRGFNGAAGEVGRLPFPWSATEIARREGLEHHLGSEALMRRVAREWPAAESPCPRDAAALFERAAAGSPPAMHWVERHAADVARMIVACVGILDPGVVVLGGGVGHNPLLAREARKVVNSLVWPTEILSSSLGNRGTVLGAVQLAADYALEAIVGGEARGTLLPAGRGQG
jgi:predicted NBD/HSP70 family sugar kinase